MPRDVVVTLIKTETCQVVVRNVPDNKLGHSPEVLATALRATGKQWDEDDVDIDDVVNVLDVEDSEWLPEVDYNAN